MKLLSPQINKEAKDKEEIRKRLRTQEIDKELEKKKRLLNDLEDDFQGALGAQQNAWEKEKDAHLEWRRQADTEVTELEKRRTTALLPFAELENELIVRKRALADTQVLLTVEQQEFSEKRDQLHSRLDQVSEREVQCEEREQSLTECERGIEAQQKSIKEQSVALSKALEVFTRDSREKENGLAQRVAFIESRESNTLIAEERIAIRTEELDDREQDLEHREQRLRRHLQTYAQAKPVRESSEL